MLLTLRRNELKSREGVLAHSRSAEELSKLRNIRNSKVPSDEVRESLSSFFSENESEESGDIRGQVDVCKGELLTNKVVLGLKELIHNSESHQKVSMSLLSLCGIKWVVSKDGDDEGHE